MAIIGTKPQVNPFGKISTFRLFELYLFIDQKGFFWFQNVVKHIFLTYIALKKKLEKQSFLDQKYGLTLWKNLNFLTSLTFRFYSLERCFLVLEYRKNNFPGLYCLKKQVGKMAIFGPKPWVNPFTKMSIFRLFELLVFIPQKGIFSFQNIVKDIFLAYIA